MQVKMTRIAQSALLYKCDPNAHGGKRSNDFSRLQKKD
jgi:hypothetical protein